MLQQVQAPPTFMLDVPDRQGSRILKQRGKHSLHPDQVPLGRAERGGRA
jgi:hypothetical protein